MEIKVNSSELLKRLELTSKVIAAKNAMQILSDVLIEARKEVMLITASDSEVWLSEKCPATSDSDFRFCVDARSFTDAVKNIADMELVLVLDEEKKVLTCSYVNGEFSMPYEDSSEFPLSTMDSSELSHVIVSGETVAKAIELVSYATAVNNIVQPILNGIHFDFSEGCMTTVATDRNRVARYMKRDIVLDGSNFTDFTMPKKPSVMLTSILKAFNGDVKISFNASSVFVSNSNFKVSARLLEFNYPNYRSVIPNSSPIVVTIDKGFLLQAIKRVLPMSDELSSAILFRFSEGCVLLSAENALYGKHASESVECDCDASVEIKMNGSKVVEALRNIDDDSIVIELTDEKKAAIIYPAFNMSRDEYVAIISPMMIQKRL